MIFCQKSKLTLLRSFAKKELTLLFCADSQEKGTEMASFQSTATGFPLTIEKDKKRPFLLPLPGFSIVVVHNHKSMYHQIKG
jgi:hypothetical protein